MRVVIQRVKSASVKVNETVAGNIQKGLLVLLGVGPEDTLEDVQWLVKKTAQLRIFSDDLGLMNNSLLDIDGELLLVSQFTLYASTQKGTRPSFTKSAKPALAKELYELFQKEMSLILKKEVPAGVFGADMDVSLTNWGPVTIMIDSKNKV